MTAPAGPVLLPQHVSDMRAELHLIWNRAPSCLRCLDLGKTDDVGVWIAELGAAQRRLEAVWGKATASSGLLTASVTVKEHDLSAKQAVNDARTRPADARPHLGNRTA